LGGTEKNMLNTVKSWRSAGNYVQGKGHTLKNIPCQDRIFSLLDSDINIIALADGAGSYLYSHYGAEVSTNTVCDILKQQFDIFYESEKEVMKQSIISELLKQLNCKADHLGISVKELSSTLMFASVRNDRYIVGHIGDGVIGMLENGSLKVLSEPDNKEYVNVTTFVTSSNACENFRINKGQISGIDGFILISDGSAQSLYDRKNNKLSLAAKEMIEWIDHNMIPEVRDALFFNLEKYLKPKTTDDCSVNMLKLVKMDIDKLCSEREEFQKDFLKIEGKRRNIFIENHLKILKIIAKSPATVDQISKDIKLSAKTTAKYISNLERGDFIAKNNDKKNMLK